MCQPRETVTETMTSKILETVTQIVTSPTIVTATEKTLQTVHKTLYSTETVVETHSFSYPSYVTETRRHYVTIYDPDLHHYRAHWNESPRRKYGHIRRYP
ncbi:unnamed protein product [Meganyctiphanes norvegica]|uniref:Uncharacterized protein n=1 Tax=Meganyctiphanes norvegica TaxID=48144 RepID=A0AAV2QXM0_MEGNR